jgi:succinate dehydrogenase hydrophobic membrane anchor protein
MRLSTTKLSGRRGSRPEPPLAMKVTKSATKTSTMQVIRVVQPNARDGLREWRLQRLTAIAVIPLSLHFAASILSVATSGRKTAADWLALPVLALVVILVVLTGITHALIGLGWVVLDYVRSHRLPVAELEGVKIGSPKGDNLMPSFAAAYSDAEIAAVSNYVIRHFGGKRGEVTAASVRASRD